MSKHYITSLIMKSAQLQSIIDNEQVRKKPDTFKLLKLKKMRLKIKDRLYRLLTAKPQYQTI